MDKARQILNEKEVLTYDTTEKAVKAFVRLYRHSRNIDMLNETSIRRDIKLKINHEQAGSIIESHLKEAPELYSPPTALKESLPSCWLIPGRTKESGWLF